MNQTDAVDKLVFQRFQAMQMSPEELLPLFSPQIISISNRDLNDQEYPPLEVLERAHIRTDNIYLMYNSMSIFMYIGRQCDPFFIYEIFKVESIQQIDKLISEDEMFENVAESGYLTALYNIISQIRYQRQPFCEIQILIEGEVESEQMVQALCVLDEQANPRYRIDYNKFMAKVTGPAQTQVPAAQAQAQGTAPQTAGYY